MTRSRRRALVGSTYLQVPALAGGCCSDLASRALQTLEARYRESLRLRGVANDLGCHWRTLERALSRAYGRNFSEILQRVRLREAQRLLAESDMKVEVVALEVGFKSRGALGKLLRRHGLPPPARLKPAPSRRAPSDDVSALPTRGRTNETPLIPLIVGRIAACDRRGLGPQRGDRRVAKELVGLTLTGEKAPPAGSPIRAGEREIGRVTSAVTSPLLDRVIALGYVHRDFVEPGTETQVVDGEQSIPAIVARLPFVAAID